MRNAHRLYGYPSAARTALGWLLCWLLLLAGRTGHAQTAAQCSQFKFQPGCTAGSLSMNTGINDISGSMLGIGDQDESWHITQDARGGKVPRCAFVIQKDANWANAGGGSKWIGSTPEAGNPTNGDYTYEKCFCVCPNEPQESTSSIMVNLMVMADDAADVYLDGNPIGSIPNYGAAAPHPVNMTRSLGRGRHCIQIVVHNTGAVVSGLNVTGTVSGGGLVGFNCCNHHRDCSLDNPLPLGNGSCDPGCVDTTLTVNTGFNGIGGSPYAVGAQDEYWHLLTDPNGGTLPRCPKVIAKDPVWGNPGVNSQWIASTTTAANSINGNYMYERCFCVCEEGDLTIDLWVMADDAANISFDNVPIGTILNYGATTPTHITATVHATVGRHCIQVQVINSAGVSSGLNVAGTVHGVDISKDNCCDNRFICGPINIRHHDTPDGTAGMSEADRAASGNGMLRSAPNPARAQTTISYTVETPGYVKLELYDMVGQRVDLLDEGEKEAGEQSFLYHTAKLAAGQYRVHLTMGKRRYTIPLTIQ